MTQPKVSNDALEEYCNNFFKLWKQDYAENQYERCKTHSDNLITDLKPLYKGKLYGTGKEAGEAYNYIYLFLMLAKGLADIIGLAELTKDQSWPEDQKKTETIWQLLWDAKERLDTFNSHCLDQEIL